MGRDQGDLLAGPRRARLPQPHRQALLHPVRIDDAGAAGRRPAGGHQISLWLVLGHRPASTSSRISTGGCWGALPERGDVVIVTPPGQSSDYIKRVIGLPGDTIELIDGIVYLNGQRGAAARRGRATMIPIDANTPCDDRTRFGDFRVAGAGRPAYCRLPVFRETLPNGRVLRHDRRRPFARATISRADHRPGGPRLPDGRQSRPQRRQPLRRSSSRAWAARCRGRISAAAPSSSPSRSTAARYWNPISWFTALRGGRAGTSLHAERGRRRTGRRRQGDERTRPVPTTSCRGGRARSSCAIPSSATS